MVFTSDGPRLGGNDSFVGGGINSWTADRRFQKCPAHLRAVSERQAEDEPRLLDHSHQITMLTVVRLLVHPALLHRYAGILFEAWFDVLRIVAD